MIYVESDILFGKQKRCGKLQSILCNILRYFIITFRHATDVDRQRQLAVCRVRYRQTRIQTGEPYYREVDTIRPQKGSCFNNTGTGHL